MIYPISNKLYNIYDVLHNGRIIIITPSLRKPLRITYNNIPFKVHVCPHGHTTVYEHNTKTEYKESIDLKINSKIVTTRVNKYTEYKNEIILSTLVLNEDNYIRQWIIFHLKIGIDRFIIYDNYGTNDKVSYRSVEKTSNLEEVLKDFIKDKKVILIKWPYPKRLKQTGISGQTTQQTHSLYAFQSSKYIGLFDIDEYINMQCDTNIKSFFKKFHTINNIGGFILLNKLFYNPHNKPTDGFNFLKIYNCDSIFLNCRQKCFVIPKNVKIFSIHKATKGKECLRLDHKKIYFNHYFFLNKKDRGKKLTNLLDKTISRHI
jgi:hypothetical protein